MSDTEGGHRTAFRYNAEKNTTEKGEPVSSLPGVPLRTLTVAEFLEQPEWLQASIRNAPFYVATQYAPKVEEPKPEPEVLGGAAEEPVEEPAGEEPAPRPRRRKAEPEEPAAE